MPQLTRALPLLAGIGLAVLAASTGLASPDSSGPQCGLVMHSQNGVRTIEGTLRSPKIASGNYRFAIKSTSNGNSSTISQGGAFSAPANELVSIGQVQLDDRARYTINFTVTIGKQTIDCTPNAAIFS